MYYWAVGAKVYCGYFFAVICFYGFCMEKEENICIYFEEIGYL
ncbi:hypothetical protein BACINT_00087 [Bacteroides intestinalis DSM 17393]|uniref:Uncharacterized protein n=1 Tax=Bacteroides intestinalis DSM 17393 TaxID=471870 RepID=B3C5A5_9BACE|nr:hypothetical protein BACINT_00087 [Bacteroides intestinalis DSM 17393]